VQAARPVAVVVELAPASAAVSTTSAADLPLVLIGRDAAAVVDDCDGSVDVDRDVDLIAKPASLVDRLSTIS
jgi:hypothetical protein